MRRLRLSIIGAALLFFWPFVALAEDGNTLLIGVETRRCLNDDAALSIAPGATATMLATRGHEFIIWPISVFSTSRDTPHMLLDGNILPAPIAVLEFVSAEIVSNEVLNEVGDCAQAVVRRGRLLG